MAKLWDIDKTPLSLVCECEEERRGGWGGERINAGRNRVYLKAAADDNPLIND